MDPQPTPKFLRTVGKSSAEYRKMMAKEEDTPILPTMARVVVTHWCSGNSQRVDGLFISS